MAESLVWVRHAAIRAEALVIGVDGPLRPRRRGGVRLPDISSIRSSQAAGRSSLLVDSDSQRMSIRDELLGLNEFLAHLAKCLLYADVQGRPRWARCTVIRPLGAFIATALATRSGALPGAEPAVMDLPSMAR